MLNINSGIARAGFLGRRGDNMVGHLTTGELVIPKSAQTPALVAEFATTMRRRGIDPSEYVAGSRMTSKNPYTGLSEFADKYSFEAADAEAAKVMPASGPAPLSFGHIPYEYYGNDQGYEVPMQPPVGASVGGIAQQVAPMVVGDIAKESATKALPGLSGIGTSIANGVNNFGTSLGFGVSPGLTAAEEAGALVTSMNTGALSAAPLTSVLGAGGIGMMAGGLLGPELFGGSQVGSSIGGGLGAAAGMALGSNMGTILGMAGGPVGAVLGGLAGTALGGLFGPKGEGYSGGQANINVKDGKLVVGDVRTKRADSEPLARSAQQFTTIFNNIADRRGLTFVGDGGLTNISTGQESRPLSWTVQQMFNSGRVTSGRAELDERLKKAVGSVSSDDPYEYASAINKVFREDKKANSTPPAARSPASYITTNTPAGIVA